MLLVQAILGMLAFLVRCSAEVSRTPGVAMAASRCLTFSQPRHWQRCAVAVPAYAASD